MVFRYLAFMIMACFFAELDGEFIQEKYKKEKFKKFEKDIQRDDRDFGREHRYYRGYDPRFRHRYDDDDYRYKDRYYGDYRFRDRYDRRGHERPYYYFGPDGIYLHWPKNKKE